MSFDINKMRKEVNQIQKERERNKSKINESKSKRGLSTLLQFYQGKPIKLILNDGEIIKGELRRYSSYEIELENKEGKFVVWKHNIKYIVIE